MYARRAKKSHRDTVTYEIEMLRFCARRVMEGNQPEEDRAVYLEGFLLHHRNLVRFFSGEQHRERQGDLSTANSRTWAHREMTAEEAQVVRIPGKALDARYYQSISKYLQHCTLLRSNHDIEWDVAQMLTEISPIIEAFERAFPR